MLTNSLCWYFLSICLSCPPNPPQVCWYKSVVEAADLLSSLPQAPVSTEGYLLRSFSGVTLSNSLWNGQRNFFQLFPSLKKKSPRTCIPPQSCIFSSLPHAESAHLTHLLQSGSHNHHLHLQHWLLWEESVLDCPSLLYISNPLSLLPFPPACGTSVFTTQPLH